MIKTLKRFFTLALIVSMLTVQFAYADETSIIEYNPIHSESEIVESFDIESMSLSRSYTRNIAELSQASVEINNGFQNTKLLLADMGIEDYFIKTLSEEELLHYATTPYIYSSTVYMVESDEGTMVPVSSDSYNNAVRIASEEVGRENGSFEHNRGTLSLTLVVSEYSSTEYKFYTFAHWPTLPNERNSHSIGAAAHLCTAEPYTASGWYEYVEERTNTLSGVSTGYVLNYDIDEEYIKDASKDNWYGMLGLFSIPLDTVLGRTQYDYKNLRASFTYIGKIQNESAAQNFNVSAGYSLSSIKLSPNISVSIDPALNVTFAIGIEPGHSVDRFGLLLDHSIHYEPA